MNKTIAALFPGDGHSFAEGTVVPSQTVADGRADIPGIWRSRTHLHPKQAMAGVELLQEGYNYLHFPASPAWIQSWNYCLFLSVESGWGVSVPILPHFPKILGRILGVS